MLPIDFAEMENFLTGKLKLIFEGKLPDDDRWADFPDCLLTFYVLH